MEALAAALALVAFAAQAQSLTKPKEFYFDEDRNTARLIVAVQGEGEPLAEQLVKQIERNRNRVESTAQLAHVAMGQGRAELGEKLKESKEELFNLRFSAVTHRLEYSGRLQQVRRDIARIYTVKRERELNIRTAPSAQK